MEYKQAQKYTLLARLGLHYQVALAMLDLREKLSASSLELLHPLSTYVSEETFEYEDEIMERLLSEKGYMYFKNWNVRKGK